MQQELLALEEKMGTVSTALTEEQLSKCLKRSCYVPPPLATGIVGHGTDDTKCSICQVVSQSLSMQSMLGALFKWFYLIIFIARSLS